MNSVIRKELRKNPQILLNTLTSKIQQTEGQFVVKSQLNTISEKLAIESEKLEQRKILSRQIGAAKKANEDSTHLITRVSTISAEINDIKQEITDCVAIIESEIAKNAENYADSPQPLLPMHLRPYTETDSATAFTGNHGELTSCHDTTIDLTMWQSFVRSTDHSTIYHDARWKEIIEGNFKHQLYFLTCSDSDKKIAGLMPLVHLNSRLFGSFTTSMPWFNYGGPLATDLATEESLMQQAAELSKKLGCSHMEIRETRGRTGWQSSQRKISMILPLPDDDSTLDASLGSKLRAQVNKARKNGLRVQFGGIEKLNEFYKVFSHNMRDLGTPVYGKKWFRDILESFPDEAFIAVASLNGTPLAAGFLLGHKDKLEIPWASSIRRTNHLGANMLMYRAILDEAINRGYEFFDFGRSTREAATHRFKKQWGAKEHDLHWHYWTHDGYALPELNPDNPKFKLAIKLWQCMPVAITRMIGPPVARNLP